MIRDDYPALAEVLGGWWHEDAGSPADALRQYLADGAPGAAAAADEIDVLLATAQDLGAASLALGNAWHAPVTGTTFREFFEGLRDELRQAAS